MGGDRAAFAVDNDEKAGPTPDVPIAPDPDPKGEVEETLVDPDPRGIVAAKAPTVSFSAPSEPKDAFAEPNADPVGRFKLKVEAIAEPDAGVNAGLKVVGGDGAVEGANEVAEGLALEDSDAGKEERAPKPPEDDKAPPGSEDAVFGLGINGALAGGRFELPVDG